MSRTISDSTGATHIVEQSRTRLVEIDCDLSLKGEYELRFHRERAMIVNGNPMSLGPGRVVKRNLADILGQTVTLPDGTVMSGAAVAAAVAAFGDQFEAEDEAAEG